MASTKNKQTTYSEELSSKTLELMLFREMVVNQDFLGRFCGIADYRWFRTPHIRIMAEFAVNYYKKYGGLVTRDLIESVINRRNETQIIEANKIDLNSAMYDFNKAKDLDLGTMDEKTKIEKIQSYVKKEALRNALLDSANDLEKNDTDDICEQTLKKFESIQSILFEKEDFGTDYGADTIENDFESHVAYLTNPAAKISTGWESLDDCTSGGFLKDGKSIYVFMGQANIGKSNILANLGYNFLKQGLKVLVLSMEMSENVYMRRFDSLISKIDIESLSVPAIAEQLRNKVVKFFKEEHPTARLKIKEKAPNSISARDINIFLEKMVDQVGWKPDVVLLDYMGLINPNNGAGKGEASMYQDGSAVAKELRALTYIWEIPFITAVQCNSSGYNTSDIGLQNIAESRAIAHHGDFIAGLYQSEDDSEDGAFHMKVLKSRLGGKPNLMFKFNAQTMEFEEMNNDIPKENASKSGDKSNQVKQDMEFDKDLFGEDLGMP